MECKTLYALGFHWALMKVTGYEGGFIAKGRTASEAIMNVFSIFYQNI